MSNETESSYHKLTKTPLATDTKLCGCQPKVITIILAIVSVVIDVIPTNAFAIYVLAGRKPDVDFIDKKYSFGKRTAHSTNVPRYIFASMGIYSCVVHLVGIIVLICGALRYDTRYYYCWFCSLFCNIFMGKFAFALFMFIFEDSGRREVMGGIMCLLILLDIPLSIFMFMALGQTAGIARNKRCLGIATTTYEFKPGTFNTPGRLVPPGSYPRQQFV